jgi:hypothetical protein
MITLTWGLYGLAITLFYTKEKEWDEKFKGENGGAGRLLPLKIMLGIVFGIWALLIIAYSGLVAWLSIKTPNLHRDMFREQCKRTSLNVFIRLLTFSIYATIFVMVMRLRCSGCEGQNLRDERSELTRNFDLALHPIIWLTIISDVIL